jgi:hypothetical protein
VLRLSPPELHLVALVVGRRLRRRENARVGAAHAPVPEAVGRMVLGVIVNVFGLVLIVL